MQNYRIWEGERTFLPGDDTSKFTIIEITGEELGWFEDVIDGKTYYVYQTIEGEVVINIVEQNYGIGEPSRGSIHRYSNLEEAAADGFEQALKDMRLI